MTIIAALSLAAYLALWVLILPDHGPKHDEDFGRE